ncbi:LysR family transcriptional regulator [Actibacterium pelagium]|uniref:LysR family transcriptional regulator n=1 Tax=Actibacterium pelagium TaxID=2029103 RepID=A0A917AN80_9RHOB|nr:LysR family transcriptional regulator [Actibacterium pelagium]
MTTAAVGQQIRGLEDYVGCQLFVRKPSGAIPTKAAISVASELTAGFGSIGTVLERLKEPVLDNRLSVSTSLAIAECWLTPRLPNFYAICDKFDLRIDTTHRLVDLRSEEFDFVIRFGPEPDNSQESVFLFDGCVVPICTPEFAAQYGLSESTKSLTGVPLIHVKEETTDPGWLNWENWGKKYGFEHEERSAIPEFPRLSSGLRGAKEGLGLVLCGMVESFSTLTEGSMVMPFGGKSATRSEFSYRLVSLRGRARSKTQNDFRDWMAAEAETYRREVDLLLDS